MYIIEQNFKNNRVYHVYFTARKRISYHNNLTDIMAIVDSSFNCSQFTKIACLNMKLTPKGALIDRDGKEMDYFGGGPEGGKGILNSFTFFKVATRVN